MWMFTVYGFFSIVSCTIADVGEFLAPKLLMVRARSIEHLKSLQDRFPELANYNIQHWVGRDYPCRIVVDRAVWMAVVSQMIEEQTWTNFKTEAGMRFGHRSKYVNALHDIWETMYRFMACK